MAWFAATGAAVTLSWLGVHTVMTGTAYDPPRALPIARSGTGDADPQASSTHRPKESPAPKPSPSGSTSEPRGAPSAPDGAERGSRDRSPAPSRSAGGSDGIKGYTVAGGQVVLDIGSASAEFVSATPAAGWTMQVWQQTEWIRVTFTHGNRSVSVFCTWNGHAPMVEIDDR